MDVHGGECGTDGSEAMAEEGAEWEAVKGGRTDGAAQEEVVVTLGEGRDGVDSFGPNLGKTEEIQGGDTKEVAGREEEVVAGKEEEEEGVEESELRDVVAPMPVIGGEAQGACGGAAESSGEEFRGMVVAAAGLAAGKARRRVRFEEGEKGLHGLAALRLRQHVPPRTHAAAEDGSVGGSKGGGAEAGVGWAGGRASDGGSSSAGGLAGGGLLGRPPPLARATSDCSWEMRRVALLGAQHGTPRASAAHSHLKFSDALDQLEQQLGHSTPTREDAASHAKDWDEQRGEVWSSQGPPAGRNVATGAEEVEGGGTEEVVEREEEEEGVEESELRDVVAPMPVIGGEAQGACGGAAESSGEEFRGMVVAAAGLAAGKARRCVRFEEGEKGLHGLAALRLRQHVPPRTHAAAEDGSVGGSKGGGAEAGVGWAGGRASDGGSSSAGGLAGGGLLGRPPPLARATSDCSWEMRRVALLGAQHGTPRASAAHSHLKFSDALDQLEQQLGHSTPTREDAASHAKDWDEQRGEVWSSQGPPAQGKATVGAEGGEGGGTEEVVGRKEEEEKEGVVAGKEEEEEGVEESELRDVVAPMPVLGGGGQGACGGGAESSGEELMGEVAAAGLAAGKARRRVRFEEGEKGLHGLAALRLRQHVPPRTHAAAEDGSVGGSKGGGAEAGVGWAGGRASDGGSSSAGGLAGGGLLGRPPPLARATSDCSWEMRRVALLGAQHGTPRASAAHSHLKFSDALDQLEQQLGHSTPTREEGASHTNEWDEQSGQSRAPFSADLRAVLSADARELCCFRARSFAAVRVAPRSCPEGKAAVWAEGGEGGGTSEVVGREEEEEKEGVVAVGEEEEEGVEESELRDVVAPMPVIGGEAQGACGGGAELRGEVAAAGLAAGKARWRVRFEEGEKGLHGLAALRLRQHVPPRTHAAAEDGSVGGSKGGGAEAGVGWAGGRASDGGSSSAGGLAGGGLLGRPPPLARATSDCSWEMRRVALLGAQHGTPRASAAHSHLKFSDALDQLEQQLGQSTPTREDAASHAKDWDEQRGEVWSSQGPPAGRNVATGAEEVEGGGTEEVVEREEEEEGVEESELRDVVAPMPVIGGEAQGACGGAAESSGEEFRGMVVAAAGLAAGKARRRVRFEEGEKGLHGLAALRLRQHVPPRTHAAAEGGSVGGSKGGGAEAGVGWAGGRASDGGSSSAGGLAGGGLLGRPPPLARATSDCSWEMRRVALLGAQHGTPRASAAHSHLKFSDALDQLEQQLGHSTPTREDAASHAKDWDEQRGEVWSSQGPPAQGKATVGAEGGEGGGTEEVVGRKEEEEKEGVVAGKEEEEEGVEESELRDVVAPMPVLGGGGQGACGGGAESSGEELMGEVAAAGLAAGKARRRVRFEEGEKGLHGLAALRLRQHVPPRTHAAAEDGSVGGSKGGGAEAGVGWAGGRASDGGSSSAGGLAGGGLLGRPPPLARATSDCSWEMRRVALLGAQHGTPRASAAHSHLKFSDALDQLEQQLGHSTPTREEGASHTNEWDEQSGQSRAPFSADLRAVLSADARELCCFRARSFAAVRVAPRSCPEGKAAVWAEGGEGGGTSEVVGREEEEEKEGVVAVGEEEEEGVEESELRDVVAPMPVIGGEAQGACGGGAELRGEVAAAGLAAGKARWRVRFEEGEKGLHGLAALRLRQHVPPRTHAAAEDGSVGGSKGGGAEAGVGWAGGRASDGGSSSAGGLAGGGLLGRPPPLARATSDCSWEMRRVALLGAQHGTPRASAAHSHLKFSDALDQLEQQLGQSTPTREEGASHTNEWDDQPCQVSLTTMLRQETTHSPLPFIICPT
ncbi:unnamed protein product [Closterium sp. NIES-65]|nr:unnamed protein product [Closterium sp. NIES-65]